MEDKNEKKKFNYRMFDTSFNYYEELGTRHSSFKEARVQWNDIHESTHFILILNRTLQMTEKSVVLWTFSLTPLDDKYERRSKSWLGVMIHHIFIHCTWNLLNS